MNLKLAFLVLALATTLGPLGLEGQVRPPGGMRQRQQLERRVEQGFARLVQAQLDLPPEQLSSLQEVMQSFREDRQTVNQAQAALRYRLDDPGLPDLTDDAAKELLAEMIRVQEAEVDLYRREQAQLLTVLSPNQLVRFYRLREEWGRRIQEMRQPGGPRGPGGGGGPSVGWPLGSASGWGS
jgi:hypothetical protein